MLERKLARTGLITTAGFRDVLELGRRTRPAPYGMVGRFTPVIPRDLRLEVADRMDAEGRAVVPLDEAGVAAAEAVIRLANVRMAGAIRMVSVSLGADPRDVTLMAFGGAGPLHACALARGLGIPRVLVPCRPGITNALGCVVADLRHDFVTTLNAPLDTLDEDRLAAVFAEQATQGDRLIARKTVPLAGLRQRFSLDMQFIGQTHLLRVALDRAELDRDILRQRFADADFARVRVELGERRAAVINANCSGIGEREGLDLSRLVAPEGRRATPEAAMTGRRDCRFDGAWHATPVYWRDHLPAALTPMGHAIVEQMDCTILIEPGDRVAADADGNLIVTIGGSHA